MDLTAIKNFFLEGTFLKAVIAAVVFLIIWFIIDRVLSGMVKRLEGDDGARSRVSTSLRSVRSAIKYILLALAVIVILQLCGINVSSLVAGVGVVSIVVGFAIQDALKDIIMGLNIVVDNYYKVGDHLIYHGNLCKVTELNLKTTKLHDLITHRDITVRNSLISEAEKSSGFFTIDIPMPYELTAEESKDAIAQILDAIRHEQQVKHARSLGLKEFGSSAVVWMIGAVVPDVEAAPQVRRNCQGIVKRVLDELGISIPYTQLVLHDAGGLHDTSGLHDTHGLQGSARQDASAGDALADDQTGGAF